MTGQDRQDSARLLRERAESYSRDARTFADCGESWSAAAYRTIAEELRKVAEALT